MQWAQGLVSYRKYLRNMQTGRELWNNTPIGKLDFCSTVHHQLGKVIRWTN